MLLNLSCRRKTRSQDSSTGLIDESVSTELWRRHLDLIPEDRLTSTGQTDFSTQSKEVVKKKYSVFMFENNLDIAEDDVLFEIKDNAESGVFYDVVGVNDQYNHKHILVERVVR